MNPSDIIQDDVNRSPASQELKAKKPINIYETLELLRQFRQIYANLEEINKVKEISKVLNYQSKKEVETKKTMRKLNNELSI